MRRDLLPKLRRPGCLFLGLPMVAILEHSLLEGGVYKAHSAKVVKHCDNPTLQPLQPVPQSNRRLLCRSLFGQERQKRGQRKKMLVGEPTSRRAEQTVPYLLLQFMMYLPMLTQACESPVSQQRPGTGEWVSWLWSVDPKSSFRGCNGFRV